MQDTIWLAVDRRGVLRMTKNVPKLSRGEIPIKVLVTVEETAFQEPTLVREIVVRDWREGMNMADLDLREMVIDEAEAAMIVADRERKLVEQLRGRGYQITEPPEAASDGTTGEDLKLLG